jgi:hypothetical protein
MKTERKPFVASKKRRVYLVTPLRREWLVLVYRTSGSFLRVHHCDTEAEARDLRIRLIHQDGGWAE